MGTYGGALRYLRQKATVWQSSLAFKPAHQAQVQSEPATPAHGAQWPTADRQGLHPLPAHDGQGGWRPLGESQGFSGVKYHDGLGHIAPAFFMLVKPEGAMYYTVLQGCVVEPWHAKTHSPPPVFD